MNRLFDVSATTTIWSFAFLFSALIFFSGSCSLAEEPGFESQLLDIQHRWATANYEASGKTQKKALDALLGDARALASANPKRAEALVWQGIVASTYAGVKGPFGAMSLAKEARDALTEAEAINPAVLNGSVYTSLGTLYYKVPGGIIGFGDDDLAREYLEKAVSANPDGIDSNYFFGEFLFEQKDYVSAQQALLKAQSAPARPSRPLADKGRQREIASLLDQIDSKIFHRS